MNFAELLNLYYPKKAVSFFSGNIKNADWKSTTTNVLIVTIVNLIIALVAGYFLATPALIVFGGVIASFLLFFMFGTIFYFIGNALGGKGKLVEQLYLLSTIELALLPPGIIVQVLSLIPALICAAGIIGFIVLAYQLYLSYLAAKVAQKLDSKGAIITVAAYCLCVIVLMIILIVLLNGAGAKIPA